MGPVLGGLIKLQSVENQLRAAKSKLVRCRRSVIIQENQVRTLASGLEAKKEEIQLTRVQADRLELELKSKDVTVAKLRAALNMAKTNKEYAAILTELNTSKADSSKIENQVLDLMKSIEEDQAQCVEVEAQIAQQKQKLEQIRKETAALATRYEAEIADIEKQWQQAAKAVPAEPLKIFKRVAETYDGEALATVEKQDARKEAYSCGGCFMGIPTEMANLLMTRDEVIRCPSCTRILVLKTPEI